MSVKSAPTTVVLRGGCCVFSHKRLAKSIKLCYTYDVLNRVTKRTKKSLTDDTVLSEENFTYDAAGNVTNANGETAQYSLNNRIMVFNGSSVGCDADGNLNSIMFDGGRMNLTYDSKNRLTSAGGHTYTYDAEDVRIRNLCGDVDTTYAYDTNGKLSRLLMKTTNGVVTKYVYGIGLIGEQNGNSFRYYHFDSRGSTVALTGGTGIVMDTFEYDTYGKMISHTGNNEVIFGYNGRDGVVTDANGLLYMRARYYSPEMRRFVNADILPGGISDAITLNRYAYANGNPVSFVDPFGLEANSSVGDLPVITKKQQASMLAGLKNIPDSLIKFRNFLSNHLTVEDFEHKYSYTVGEFTYNFAISSSFGTGELDIDKILDVLDNQIEISKSFDFAGGKFNVSSKESEILKLSYSAQMDDYTKLTAAFKFSNDLSVGAEYKIETLLKELEGRSITTTFGVKRNNNLTQTPQPQKVPVLVDIPDYAYSEKSTHEYYYNKKFREEIGKETVKSGAAATVLVTAAVLFFLLTRVPVFL